MEHKASTARSDLEQLVLDETAEPKALPLSLLEDITGGFSKDQEIGYGGFAVVYKGIVGDRVVAVKKLTDSYMDEYIFHREIECLMRVKHKNVVRFLGYCANRHGNILRHDGKLIMADVHQRLLCFEYITKGSLDKYIIDPRREWGMCYKIIKGICEGLQNLHENHIVHLDLKPNNILLDNNMTPKITDFGLSRCFNENQSRDVTKTVKGTMGYIAPECWEGGVIARSVDIYSLGVIIIEILTGQKGYKATEDVIESWSGRLERSKQETLCEQIQVCYVTALECREFNPMDRPASVRNILDRLRQVESNQAKNSDKGLGGGEKMNNVDKRGRGSEPKNNNSEKGRGGGEQTKNADNGSTDNKQKKNADNGGKDNEQKKNADKGRKGDEQKKNSDKGVDTMEQKKNPNNVLSSAPREVSSGPRKEMTVLLRIQLHCDECAKKVRRRIRKIKGVKDVVVEDIGKDEVQVVGTMDVAAMVVYLKDKLRRNVEAVVSDRAADVHKDKEKLGTEAAAASNAPTSKKDDNKDNGRIGNGEKKPKNKAAAAGDVPLPDWAPNYVYPQRPSYDNSYGGNANASRYYNQQPSAGGGSYYQYQPPPYYMPDPQACSDENPNACSVM